MALHHSSLTMRIALMLTGAVLLTLYGTSLNLAPVDFASVTGIYIAMVFVMFQTVNYIFFRVKPSPGTLIGGLLIVAGGMIAFIFRPAR